MDFRNYLAIFPTCMFRITFYLYIWCGRDGADHYCWHVVKFLLEKLYVNKFLFNKTNFDITKGFN